MGCTQAKYTDTSQTKSVALENLKMESGYMAKQALESHGRSTGHEKPSYSPLQSKKNNTSFGSGGSSGGGKRINGVGSSRNSGGGKEKQGGLQYGEEKLVDGWPRWLTDNVSKEVLAGLVRKSAENYVMIDKVGQGTYSNVYKARERKTGKIVALKKVRFDTSEPESVKFMAREIMILRKLDHPNVVKLQGLATSRMQYSIYLVFDFMQSDLARIILRPEGRLTEPQVKCYMHQLLSGLRHCHDKGILHRDIKGSNLLIDRNGELKIADFGLANYYIPKKGPLTSRVVTLWYRAPELLLGATDYDVGIDLWSAGCLLAEMLAGMPIMPGRTEVEQLHRIFKLCGTPSEEYLKKFKLSTTFRPPKYQPSLFKTLGEFPESSLGLLMTLLALDPAQRGSASLALQDEFFYTAPLACDVSGLPVIQQDKDEPAQEYENRKQWRSKMKHSSRTVHERNKDLLADRPKGDHSLVKTEPKMSNIQRQAAGSSTSSIASSGTKTSGENESLSFLPSPVTLSKHMTSPATDYHPNGINNIIHLPQVADTQRESSKYRINQLIHRSTSTREFRKLNQRNPSELYAVDN